MRTILKWVGRILGGLVGLIVVAVIVIFVLGGSKINKTYDVEVAGVEIPTDDAALERGEYIANGIGVCTACHGDDLGGEPFIEDAAFALMDSANLTAGAGGLGATYSDEDWVRAIRHGVKADGRSVIIMPSHHYYFMSDEDLGALLAYLKTVPPVDHEVPEPKFGPAMRLFVLLEPSLQPAGLIDHDAPRPDAPAQGVTPEYGEYLVEMGTCTDCHGAELNGAPSSDFEGPPGSNLTPGGELAGWSEEDFINTIRTGVNPAGRELLSPMVEAVDFLSEVTDDDLAAMFLYLQSLPARETGY